MCISKKKMCIFIRFNFTRRQQNKILELHIKKIIIFPAVQPALFCYFVLVEHYDDSDYWDVAFFPLALLKKHFRVQTNLRSSTL